MHRLTTTFVLGYHGCDESVVERLISGEPFQKSINDYDWLGPGIYFWEANPLRGLEFAVELQNAHWGSDITTPAVVGVIIDLGFCLDLTTAAGIRQVRAAHASYISNCEQTGDVIPQNSADANYLRRQLDCAVFTQLHQIREDDEDQPIDTVRGVFVEGEPAYEGAGFRARTHIQICVCNTSSMKGVFRAPPDQLI